MSGAIDCYPEWWASIPGFPSYEASTRGRIRRIRKQSGSFSGRLLKPFLNKPGSRGRWRVALCEGCVTTRHYVARLVAATFNGPCPHGHEVDHADTNRDNNRPGNLEYVTSRENKRRWVTSKRFGRTQAAQAANGWTTPRSAWAA